jgi:hypothetical protein
MMRAIAILALSIATAIVGVCCVYLGAAAYSSAPTEWQAVLTTSWVVPLAVWEALAMTAAMVLWKHGYKPLAPIAVFSLIGALALTARYDILAQSTASSDRVANRASVITSVHDDRAQLDALRAQQGAWLAKLSSKDAKADQLNDIRDTLNTISANIERLSTRASNKQAPSEAAPDAAMLAWITHSGSEHDWSAWLTLGAIAGLAALRVMLLPCAAAFAQIVWRQDPHSQRARIYEATAHLQERPANDVKKQLSHAELAKLACQELPHGNILRTRIENAATALATKHGGAITREQLTKALAEIGVRPAKRDGKRLKQAEGAIYVNVHGIHPQVAIAPRRLAAV